jgi:predicted cupin superfamily sugar epimerase
MLKTSTLDRLMQETVKRIVERFELRPHPEGGYFREVYRSALSVDHPGVEPPHGARRSAGTQIYFLLATNDFSAFHRVRSSDEIWHLYAGGRLELHTIDDRQSYAKRVLTTDLESGEPMSIVPAGCWQAARLAPGSDWAFCGCTVAPGFDFADFEMPPAHELVAAYPAHETVIRELTRR